MIAVYTHSSMQTPTARGDDANKPFNLAQTTPEPHNPKPQSKIYTMSLTDAQLMQRLALRDQNALSELYDRYSNLCYGLALRVAGNQQSAEEIVQDCFLKLWNEPQRFDPNRAALSTYIITMVRNKSIDTLRRRKPTSSLDDDEGQPLAIASNQPQPLERAQLAQNAEQVRAALLELTEVHRRTVELAYFEDASREEIATAMNVPVGTVKSRLKYALDKLRQSLGQDFTHINEAKP